MKLFERFEIVEGHPALYDPATDVLAITDLHLGIESVMAQQGTYFPRVQLEEVEEELAAVLDATGASTLLIDGDVKNEFSGNERGEWQETKEFLEFALDRVEEVEIVQGNHDNYLIYAVKEYDAVTLDDYFIHDDVAYLHGHDMPEALDIQSAGTLIIGHEHPALALRDDAGVTEKVACFLYGQLEDGRNLVVLPAFSTLAEGTPINRSTDADLLSPILTELVDVDSLTAVGVDRDGETLPFTTIGKLRGV